MTSLLKFPKVFALMSVVLGGLPFLIYLVERNLGSLPTSESWYATGANHGPWRNGAEGLTIYYPLIVLLVVTVVAFASRGVKDKQRSLIAFGLFLVIIQLAILVAQMYLLTWTVD
jgi:hypothetical protein